MMDWDLVDSTLRQTYRKNGKNKLDVRQSRTPLGALIAKDQLPDLDEMTEPQLCEYAGEHHIPTAGVTREGLIETIRQANETNWEERLLAMRMLIDFLFADGPHPLAVVRRAYALAKAVRPQCIMNMSCASLAVLSDDGKGDTTDGRATVSERIKRIFSEPIRKAGMLGSKASFQKTDSACGTYSDSAKGNQNRRGRDYLEAVKNQQQQGRKAA